MGNVHMGPLRTERQTNIQIQLKTLLVAITRQILLTVAITRQFLPLHENERIWTPGGGGARVPGAPPWIRQLTSNGS